MATSWAHAFQRKTRHSYSSNKSPTSVASSISQPHPQLPTVSKPISIGPEHRSLARYRWRLRRRRDTARGQVTLVNVFSASQPYPVPSEYANHRYDCECDRDCCIADHDTRASSSCINVNQDILCDGSICFFGLTYGNRMKQRYTLDLLQTPVGLGVVCSNHVPKDPFIIEYVGGVLLETDAVECVDRSFQVAMKTKATGKAQQAFSSMPRDVVMKVASLTTRANPTVLFSNSNGRTLHAWADIHSLRELTFRYYESKLSMFTCQCGHPNCIEHRNVVLCICITTP
ncbi:hypothetical protein GQ600_11265 [Phytophthora cactorum]|nr:hypothetical protein GQ600_11265 [Phytophthora cactorum]